MLRGNTADQGRSSSVISVKAAADSSDGTVSVIIGESEYDDQGREIVSLEDVTVEVPIIGGAKEGDDVLLNIVNGNPVAVGAAGWGATVEGGAESAYVTHVQTGDEAGLHVHENETSYNTGGDFWINPNLTQIRNNGQMVAQFAKNGALFCEGNAAIFANVNPNSVIAHFEGQYLGQNYSRLAEVKTLVDTSDASLSGSTVEINASAGSIDSQEQNISSLFIYSSSDRPAFSRTVSGEGSTFEQLAFVSDIPAPPSFEPVLLWSGSWQSGSITVPNFTDYHRYIIYIGSENVPLEASRTDTHNRVVASASYSTSTPYLYIYTGSFSYSDDVLTYLHAAYSRLDNHAITKQAITQIWGVI